MLALKSTRYLVAMTLAQKRAADPATSVWVSASAGTGKTKVLVDRLMRILYQGTPISHIVCLTFTKAAALEMRERLLARLQHDSNTKEIAANLYESLLESPESLKIMTLHAYCQGLLQKFPFEAGILPFFDVLDDDQASQLLKQALSTVLISPPTEAIAKAIEGVSHWMGEYVFQQCLEDAFSRWHKVRHLERIYPDPDQYRMALENAFAIDFPDLTAPFIDTAGALRLLQESSQPMDRALGASLLADGLAPFLFLTKDGAPRKRIVSADFKKRYPDLANTLEAFAHFAHHTHLRQTYEGWLDANTHFWQIVQAVLSVFQTLKTEQGLLDYHDLILHSLALFSDDHALSFVHQRLDYTIDHILVDEAQDNSPEQWLFILKLVDLFIRDDTPHRSLFVVGDVKQSIYGFQGAVPYLFETLRGTFQNMLTNRGHDFIQLTLGDSFRTTADVLRVVDDVFMEGALIGMGTYTNHTPYRRDKGWVGATLLSKEDFKNDVPNNADEEPPVHEWVIVDAYTKETSKNQILANYVVDGIEKALNEKWALPSLSDPNAQPLAEQRAIEPRDILILLRNRGTIAADIIRTLKQRHIAVEGPDRIYLSTRQCIQDVMAVLRFLCLPEDDLSLASILKSPFANHGQGFDEETLFDLCHNRDESLWHALCERETLADAPIGTSSGNAIHPELIAITKKLKAWLVCVDYQRPSFLLKSIIAPALPAFENRLGSDIHLLFETFLDTVLTIEVKASTLSEVLFKLEQSMPVIKRDPARPTGVRLMTIHGSKGLEAPFVIVVDRDERIDLAKENMLWPKIEDTITGEIVEIFCLKPKSTMTMDAMVELRTNALTAQRDENNRLLYVALTRPRDALFVIGSGGWTKVVKACLQAEADVPFSKGVSVYKNSDTKAALPNWIERQYEQKMMPNDPPALPADVQTKAMQRGQLIHRVIEMLIKTPKDRWDILLEAFQSDGLSQTDTQTIKNIIAHPNFSFLFDHTALNSWAEMEIMDDGKLHRIDMLIETQYSFLILDFKTGQPCFVQAYVQQLKTYAAFIRQIADKKNVRTFLVWIDALVLEEISL